MGEIARSYNKHCIIEYTSFLSRLEVSMKQLSQNNLKIIKLQLKSQSVLDRE